MARRHSLYPSAKIRRSFAFAILSVAGFACATTGRAQDALSVSPMPDIETIGDAGLRAYVAALPSAPTPKVEPGASALIRTQSGDQISTKRAEAFYRLDRASLIYGLAQGGAEIFDGITTRNFVHHCSLCFENDPVSRLLLGTHPSWSKMIPLGVAEAVVSTYSYRRLSHSPNRFLRGAAPLVPIGLTAVHVIEGARNIGLKNKYRCAEPGFIVVGSVCVTAPPLGMTGPTAVVSGGLGSRKSPL